jgi:exopolyphosphatase/guanosine-5'-triphosphate,3'-diphosphate pyrophosphatase
MKSLAALDLGSGTIKLSVFEKGRNGWTALSLVEANTELRKGLGPELTLKPRPIRDTLAAVAEFQIQANALGVRSLPAYATSAVRKASNPEALLGPLKAMGIKAKVLTEEEEGRWNLLGALARLDQSLAPSAMKILVCDPGGDSTECAADVEGSGWEQAVVASLPFGSVSLQEHHGSAEDNGPLAWKRLEAAAVEAKAAAQAHPRFKILAAAGLTPAIRVNAPIQRALEQVNGLPLREHGQGGAYGRPQLETLCRATAALDHPGRAKLLAGEPLGKVDRTCYGFASWLGLLDAFRADRFLVEPWGIKLGAVIALNS